MDKDNGTINTRLTIVNVQALGDGGERITVAPERVALTPGNDTQDNLRASGSIDFTFTDKAQVGLYKAGDAFNVTFSPTLDVTNRQRSANTAEHISTR